MFASWEMSGLCRGEMIKRLLIALLPKPNVNGMNYNCCKAICTITKTNFGQVNFKVIITSVGS
jgi:hypothetical protein